MAGMEKKVAAERIYFYEMKWNKNELVNGVGYMVAIILFSFHFICYWASETSEQASDKWNLEWNEGMPAVQWKMNGNEALQAEPAPRTHDERIWYNELHN